MKIDLEAMPALFAEIAAKSDAAELRPLVKALAARCALFAGVVGKMAAHISALDEKIGALGPKAPDAKPAPKEEAKDDTVPLNPDATLDLDAEIRKLHPDIEASEPQAQKGTRP